MTGKDAAKAFKNEAGGHRWQRVPPTERKGRVHTSTVTVSVLPELTQSELRLNERDLHFKATRGSGPGGQHRNKTASAIQLMHIPTGISVRVESEKSQHRNKEAARSLLRARLQEAENNKKDRAVNSRRKAQVGSGQRADKRRTVRLQANQVVDHVTGKRTSARKYLRGSVPSQW